MKEEENKKIVKQFFERFSSGQVDETMEMMADDGTYWIAGKLEKFALAGTRTKEEFAALLKSVLETMPEGLKLTPKPDGFTAEGDRVAVEVESYAKLKNGRIYNNLYHFLVVIRNGKIHQVKEYLDTMHTQEVLIDV